MSSYTNLVSEATRVLLQRATNEGLLAKDADEASPLHLAAEYDDADSIHLICDDAKRRCILESVRVQTLGAIPRFPCREQRAAVMCWCMFCYG